MKATQKQLLKEAMKSVVSDSNTTEPFLSDVFELLTKNQLNALEDLITNHYPNEENES